MFQGINGSCRVNHGCAGLSDATQRNSGHADAKESLFLGETLNYLHVRFSDTDILSTVDWAFSPEAHPMRFCEIETQQEFADVLLFKETIPKDEQ
jgi:hypothetical protein